MPTDLWSVLKTIGEKIIGLLAQKALDALRDSEGSPITAYIAADSLAKIKGLLADAFKEFELQSVQDGLDTVVAIMHQFDQAPIHTDRLEEATARSTEVMVESMSLGLSATSLFLLGATMHYAILQTRFKAFGDPGEKENAKDAIDSYTKHAKDMLIPGWADYANTIVSPVKYEKRSPAGNVWIYTYYFHGIRQVGFAENGDAEEKAEKAREKKYQQFLNTTPIPLVQKTLKEWSEIKKSVDIW